METNYSSFLQMNLTGSWLSATLAMISHDSQLNDQMPSHSLHARPCQPSLLGIWDVVSPTYEIWQTLYSDTEESHMPTEIVGVLNPPPTCEQVNRRTCDDGY